ncbi:DNA cytosine methyltransferase [Streptomyces sp. NPDC001584]|uniref:DNA cytosine methyltransferase n=1 Tax=Streptomyces sp. NPDC001584 TaxID=3154521 RepID=UPI00331D6F0D
MAFNVTWSDQFAGGGGACEGLERVPGTAVVQAGNHAAHCVATYRANHPGTQVHLADLSQVVPSAWPRTHALWSSPECTFHTVAQGQKRLQGEFVDGLFSTSGEDETAIRSRATMHCVPRFAEYHQYLAIVVENVVEARWWGPRHNRGAAFDAWIAQLRVWGYHHRLVFANSAHAAAYGPASHSSRDRMYVVLWHESVGRTPDFDKWLRPAVECQRHGRVQALQAFKLTDSCSPNRPWGKHGAQYTWRCPHRTCAAVALEPYALRPVAEILDAANPGPLIGERFLDARRARTWQKIQGGHRAYGGAPFIAELRGGGSTHRPTSRPLSTLTAGGNHHLWVHGDAADVRDRHARLLTIEERKVAMAFPGSYELVATAEKRKDRDQQLVSMIGMAVTPNIARDLGAMVSEFITGQELDPLRLAA